MNATISPNEIPVMPTQRQDDGTFWLVVDVPNGWDDVKKICKKVLNYDGRKYVFMSWNSDTNRANFKASPHVATISR